MPKLLIFRTKQVKQELAQPDQFYLDGLMISNTKRPTCRLQGESIENASLIKALSQSDLEVKWGINLNHTILLVSAKD